MSNRCYFCGKDLVSKEGALHQCGYCKKDAVVYAWDDTVPRKLDEALRLRLDYDYDHAEQIYEEIIATNPDCVDAYWGALLSRYGVEISERSHYRPVSHRTFENSFLEEPYYRRLQKIPHIPSPLALGNDIELFHCELIKAKNNQQKYDIFISYKEGGEDGRPTRDSEVAKRLYYELEQKGYRTFYAPVSLKDYAGLAYESNLYAALNSADTMILLASKDSYINGAWVANEWKRYKDIIAKNQRNLSDPRQLKLFVCHFGDLTYAKLPEALERYQSVNLDDGNGEAVLDELLEKFPDTLRKKGFIANDKDHTILEEYVGSDSKITIPENFKTIAQEAFLGNADIREIDFSNVESIGDYAFEACKNLRTVLFSKIKTVGISAFEDCDAMTKISFPQAVILKEAAFYSCKGLREVNFEKTVKIGQAVFERCEKLWKVGLVSGPNVIGISAFDKCGKLEKIETLEGVTKLSDSAFRRCEKLREMIIPASIKTIGTSVFASCDNLTITCLDATLWQEDWNCGRPVESFDGDELLPEETKEFSENEFIEMIELPDTGERFFVKRKNRELIGYDGPGGDIVIPKGILSIADRTFLDNRDLTSVRFNDVKKIGEYCFDNCTDLHTLILDNVTHVGASAFEDCESLKTVGFQKRVTVGDSAFFACEGLEEVVFNELADKIDNAAFERSNVKRIVFKQGCREIGNTAFSKCWDLEEIGSLDGLTELGDSVFRRCNSLKKLILPETLSAIGKSAFTACNNLTIYYRHKGANWPDDWHSGRPHEHKP